MRIDLFRGTPPASQAAQVTPKSVLADGLIDNGISATFYFKKGAAYAFAATPFYLHSPEMIARFGNARKLEIASPQQLESGSTFSLVVKKFTAGAGGWTTVATANMAIGARSVAVEIAEVEANAELALGFTYDGVDMLSAHGVIYA